MKMKADYINNVNGLADAQVEKLIKNSEKTEGFGSIVNNDIDKQEENFKNRLVAKRRKIALSNSDITEQVELIKNKRFEENEGKNHKSFIFENKNELFHEHNNLIENDDASYNVILHHLDKDISFDGAEHSDFRMKIDETEDHFQSSHAHTHDHFKKNKKQEKVFGDIKHNIDHFLSDFNFHFYEDIFQRVVEEIENILEFKHNKTLEISKNYNDQIKEMEFLLTSGKKILFYIKYFRSGRKL